jgi:uncharacterized protein (AIM24 family)
VNREILYRPSYSLLKVSLGKGEAVSAEAGAMVSTPVSVNIETQAKGGLFGALKKRNPGTLPAFRLTAHRLFSPPA